MVFPGLLELTATIIPNITITITTAITFIPNFEFLSYSLDPLFILFIGAISGFS